jgi:hypothetical protein
VTHDEVMIVDGHAVRLILSVQAANRYKIDLNDEHGGFLVIEIPWHDIATNASGFRELLEEHVRCQLLSADHVINYPQGRGPVIRKDEL